MAHHDELGPVRTMTDAQHEAVATWLRQAADQLLLADWEILLERGHPDAPEAWATTHPQGSYHRAWIRVGADLLLESPAYLARALVHELVHLHHGDLKADLEDALTAVGAGPEVRALAAQVVVRHVEHLVDQVARIIAAGVKLPSVEPLRKA